LSNSLFGFYGVMPTAEWFVAVIGKHSLWWPKPPFQS